MDYKNRLEVQYVNDLKAAKAILEEWNDYHWDYATRPLIDIINLLLKEMKVEV